MQPKLLIFAWYGTLADTTNPIILVGRDFWQGMIDWIADRLLTRGFIKPDDLDLFETADTADEVTDIIFRHYENCTDGFCINPNTDWELGL